jgi:uncharacterized membrane protein YkoI
MSMAGRFVVAALSIAAAQIVLVAASADDAAPLPHESTLVARTCLNQKERRAELEAGRVVTLTVALHAAKSRMAGTLVRARLCHGHSFGQTGLVYVLTVLARDGKVARLTIDAAKGTLIGGL